MKDSLTDIPIIFHFETDGFKLNNKEQLTSWLLQVIVEEEKEIDSINYIFCNDDYLLKINKEYLNHDYYTDVISFPYSSSPIKGDIFISIDRVKENSQNFDSDFQTELHRVMVHGLLHFIGYNDKDEASKKEMNAKENHFLRLLL